MNKKIIWSCSQYEAWREWCQQTKDPEEWPPAPDEFNEISDEKICQVLKFFIMEVRKKDGTKYPPRSLDEMVKTFLRYIAMKGKIIDVVNDEHFKSVNSTLKFVMSSRAKEGLGVNVKRPKPITQTEEDYLWDNGYLGHDTPQKLSTTLFWLLSSNFNILMGRDGHRDLTIRNFEVGSSASGVKYLKYLPSNASRKPETVFENLDPEKCVVKTFEKYIKLVEPEDLEDAFYWKPYKEPKQGSTGEVWFGRMMIGIRSLDAIVRDVMLRAGFEGYYTNCSQRTPTNIKSTVVT